MRKKTYPIKEVINSVLKDVSRKDNSIEAQVVSIWQNIAEKEAGGRASVINFNNGILRVKVVNSSYFYKFTILKTKLVNQLNKEIGQEIVKDIMFNI